MTIDTSNLQRIAFATSAGSGASRWTDLALFYRPGERRPFVAESWGRTREVNEREFHRQRVAKTIDEALNHFDNSRLSDDMRTQAQAWEDSCPFDPAALNGAPAAAGAGRGRGPAAIRFDGAGGLLGALRWLYRIDGAITDSALSTLIETDWGVPARTVRHALAGERVADSELPSWCKAFVGALQHFDRDAFLATRRPA